MISITTSLFNIGYLHLYHKQSDKNDVGSSVNHHYIVKGSPFQLFIRDHRQTKS